MQGHPFSLRKAAADVLTRRRRRADRNLSDLWWVDDLGPVERALVQLAKLRGIAVRCWAAH
jgi:hypothetical protein